MKNYTVVNQKTCIACGTCGDIAPDIFGYTQSGEAYVLLDENKGTAIVPENLLEDLEEAEFNCPSKSILVLDESLRVSGEN